MRRKIILLGALVLLATMAVARIKIIHSMHRLTAESKLVFVGRVDSISKSGITTTLSYPPLRGATFEWLRVDVDVVEPIKGVTNRQIVHTAMLSLKDKGDAIMYSPPDMIGPVLGKMYLLFLVPGNGSNLFAGVTAPYDEDQSIFILDRNSRQYAGYQEARESRDPYYENAGVIFSLVDEKGRLLENGVQKMRQTYAGEIKDNSSNLVMSLQWETETNSAGWMRDVPKGTAGIPEPKRK